MVESVLYIKEEIAIKTISDLLPYLFSSAHEESGNHLFGKYQISSIFCWRSLELTLQVTVN